MQSCFFKCKFQSGSYKYPLNNAFQWRPNFNWYLYALYVQLMVTHQKGTNNGFDHTLNSRISNTDVIALIRLSVIVFHCLRCTACTQSLSHQIFRWWQITAESFTRNVSSNYYHYFQIQAHFVSEMQMKWCQNAYWNENLSRNGVYLCNYIVYCCFCL